VLALRGGAELVALWAQVASVIELVTGVAAAGVGTGLAVYVARSRRPERQRDFLREAFLTGLGVGAPLALLVGAAGAAAAGVLSGGRLAPWQFVLAAAAAWVAIAAVLVNSYWLGQQRRLRMLALALAAAAASLLAAWLAPDALIVPALVASQAVPAACVLFVARRNAARPRFRMGAHPLRRYVLPGLAIGILGPASLLLARGEIGAVLGWHEAGVVQALWRLADWVCAFAAGLLSLHYLPRFAAARGGEALNAEMRHAALSLLPPAGAAFAALWILHRPLLAALYGPRFEASDAAAALFFAGSLIRVASWIPLFALYAVRRTSAITAGELLSLPLFAASVLLAGAGLSVEAAGGLWAAAFGAYAIFNLRAATRR